MRAAIYARRSTDEHQATSLDVQCDEGRRYIASKGWKISPEHVFIDDAISRAEFKKRPGLIALLNAAEAGAFDVLIVRDESRLGGDMYRTGLVIQNLIEAGVRLFYYYTDEEIALEGAVDKFLVAARNFASELEREKTSQRTHEHLLTKARKGLNVGGRVYGYDNVEVREGDRRVRVEYKINPAQAAIVREIFRKFAAGDGLRTIAKDLNNRRVAPPRAGRRGTGSWAPSCIREMLRRDRYRGVLIWGREGKSYKGGTRVRVSRPECDVIRAIAPHLRIVSEKEWAAVEAKTRRTRKFSGRAGAAGPSPRYLLSGSIARCECGGPMQATNGKHGSKTIKVYSCAWRRARGPAVCSNSFRRPIESVDAALVGWLRENVLREELVVETLRQLRQRLRERAATSDSERPELEAELRKLKSEIDRLTMALASADEKPDAVIRAIAEREKRVVAIKSQLEALRATPAAIDTEVRGLEEHARRRLADLRTLLSRNPQEARKALETLLDAPLTVKPLVLPDGSRRFQIEGEVGGEALFTTEGDPDGI